MDYNDINKIAELMDDTAKKSKLSGPIISSFIPKTSDGVLDYDITKLDPPNPYHTTRLLLNHKGTPAKSVTLLEMSGYRVMPRRPKPAAPKTHQAPQQVHTIPKLGSRKIEL